jgi:hypothetical protein
MFKLEFDPANKQLATAIGSALVQYGLDEVVLPETETQTAGPSFTATRENLEAVAEAAENTTAESDDFVEAEPDTSAEPDDTTDTGAPVDENGVPHNDKYCVGLKAQNKFYKSGANKGSWIKGKGVDVSAYNEWYASALPDEPEAKPDTSAAFGSKPEPSADSNAPRTAGELTKWVSENQQANNLTQDDIKAAYEATGLSAVQLFQGTDDEKAEKVATLHACLTATINSKG